MIIFHASGFKKRVRRLPFKIKKSLAERLRLFAETPYHPLLDNHTLKGIWRGYRSINITGDWRVVYEPVGTNVARLMEVDTHHNLYGT